MKHKSKTRFLFQSFYNMTCTQFNTKIEATKADNAQEFFVRDIFCVIG